MDKHSSHQKDGHFDYISSSTNINIDDSRGVIMDGCAITTKDIVINIVDGNLDQSGDTSSGAFVSNEPQVTDIFGDSCVDVGNCMAFCPDSCLRSLYLKVEQFGTENWELKVRVHGLKRTSDPIVDLTCHVPFINTIPLVPITLGYKH